MQIRNWITSERIEMRGFVLLFCLVLLPIFTHAVALAAEQPDTQLPSTPFGATGLNNPAHDTTMTGTVQRLIAAPAAGLQLVIDGPQGSLTASLGPNVSREVRQSLSEGTPVQISGQMQTIDGKQYLLARKLTIDGKQIVVRNENGFLIHPSQRSHVPVNNSALYRSAK